MPDPRTWTVLELVKWTADYFGSHALDNARSEAEVLLAHSLGLRRIDLYLDHDKPLCDDELRRFKDLIKRRIDREPLAYITGTREFWSLPFSVNPSVLIPRPETECLVEAVLPFLAGDASTPKRVLDMGTGSGAIVVALAHEHPRHRYTAMDRSLQALRTARENAHRNRVDRCIDWFCGSWEDALRPDGIRFDLIASNPPYVRSGDLAGLQPEIRRHEPRSALDAGADGLDCLRRIIRSAHRLLGAGGVLALEMGCDQGAEVRSLGEAAGAYTDIRIVRDYSGLDRVAVMRKKALRRIAISVN
ncbi:MAG TPA: peptide chain release factor N(5)-glutamine methyltransferase [Desulfosarcina sp.]|nr:peptide chain release factor N(5)-glutamine methyltransferase [Desulfosarcina sp.]